MFEPEKQKDGTSVYKTAFETTDNPCSENFLTLNQNGVPQQKVFFDETRDMAAHWSNHETTLWIILIICCLYFLTILAG